MAQLDETNAAPAKPDPELQAKIKKLAEDLVIRAVGELWPSPEQKGAAHWLVQRGFRGYKQSTITGWKKRRGMPSVDVFLAMVLEVGQIDQLREALRELRTAEEPVALRLDRLAEQARWMQQEIDDLRGTSPGPKAGPLPQPS